MKHNKSGLVSRPPNIVFIGKKPILTYLNATLTLLANEPTVTIKARGRSMVTAVDVSQMIVKRMSAMGYKVSGVRIFSERLESNDGKERNVSTIEVDVSRSQNAQ
ncbi:MAG: DNA-binding protein [Thaumarchaeota archaeon]|nr:DNA-binding protein [Nitrososphaerota archaeon]MDE1817273.1 DNA-binding protein [Nitrososphaerota archaeon]MDE1875490.1 DNA-binding protein [Nitrososphaerota archaeon]